MHRVCPNKSGYIHAVEPHVGYELGVAIAFLHNTIPWEYAIC